MSGDDSALAREAEYLHGQFFRCTIPDLVVQRYVAANRVCFPEISPAEARLLETVVNRRLDAEAVELALRLKRGKGVLTRKIQVLFYLVEVRSAYRGYFVHGGAIVPVRSQLRSEPRALASGRRKAWVGLLGSLTSTVWKALKGYYLIWRHALV